MKNLSETYQTGEIVFWNGVYGFIQLSKKNNIFFHKSGLNENYANRIKLLDKVKFQIAKSTFTKHKGKTLANDIKFIRDGQLSNYSRYIGQLSQWNGRFGFIKNPKSIWESIFLYHTRVIFNKTILKNDGLLVFSPMKYSEKYSQLFAFFAYPIEEEKDVCFLKEKLDASELNASQLEKIKEYISKIIKSESSIAIRFELELQSIGFVDDYPKYSQLIKKIQDYKNEFEYSSELLLMKNYCAEKYLIQLWETEIISEYDLDVMKNYFHFTNADNKRKIILRFSEDIREVILLYHFKKLKEENELDFLTNKIKTFLDIIYRNKDTQNPHVYIQVIDFLYLSLNSNELINLWLDGYIDKLSKKIIVNNIDINNSMLIDKLIKKDEEKYTEAIKKIYENYFIKISKEDFDKEFPILVTRLSIFESLYKSRYEEIIKIVSTTFNDFQKFSLWIFGVEIKCDSDKCFKLYQNVLNSYYQIKYILKEKQKLSIQNPNSLFSTNNVIQKAQVDITQKSIEEFSINYKWNNLISLTQIISDNPDNVSKNNFLYDIKLFIKEFDRKDINIDEIAINTFNGLKKYQVFHLRLWLYGYVPDGFYHFIGFRNSFKELTYEEQKLFKKIGNFNEYNTNVILPEKNEVIPCKKFVLEANNSKTYTAFIENIYFNEGGLRLRTENKSYTNITEVVFASSGLNRIQQSNPLNKLPMQIKVSDKNEIISIEGINKILTRIHTGEIERTLGTVVKLTSAIERKNKSFVEDWNLRKQIIDYLNKNQYPIIEPKAVYEPKNFFRRLDQNSDIDSYELTRLFSIKTDDGFAIIWENIDLTEDRATYIFKTTENNHNIQIEKLTNAIVSSAQLRSALYSTKKDSKLQIFKNDFGYIKTIRKQRGKNKAFNNWQSKLASALKQTIPEIPSSKELEDINEWSPDNPHHARIKKQKNDKNFFKEIPIWDNEINEGLFHTPINQNKPINKKSKSNNHKELLTTLKEFNKIFTKNIKIK